MKKLSKLVALFLMVNINIFCLKLSELDFNRDVIFGEKTSKNFFLVNNSNEEIEFILKVIGDRNVQISPLSLKLLPKEMGKFTISVTAKKNRGEHTYFLELEERKIKMGESGFNLNNIIKIKQKYRVK